MSLDENIIFRFGGIERLFGAGTLDILSKSRVCIIGLGGVGSWVAEALARSGVGNITLVDFDDICVSNVSRQVHATTSTVGKLKTEALRERIQQIHPTCRVSVYLDSYSADTALEILKPGYDYVIDAIDGLRHKIHLIATCKKNSIPILTVGAGGGRKDPSKIHISDLAFTHTDRLLMYARKRLRQYYDFPRSKREAFGVACVFSSEFPHHPTPEGKVSQDPQFRQKKPLDCSVGLGTASFLTGTIGFFAAYRVIEDLLKNKTD